MKTFNSKLIAALAFSSLALAGSAFACGGGGGGGYGGGFGGNGGGYGGNNNQNCRTNNNYNNYSSNYGQAFEPFHSSYFVQPGDNFYIVSLKEYGNSGQMKYIAQYNRLSLNSALVPGQRLLLPTISSRGRLTASRAPAAEQFNTAPGQFPTANTNFIQPTTTTTPITTPVTTPAASTEPLPSVPTGSVLKLDGQSLGTEAGVVRLRVSNVAFPVEVVEWAADSTKVRLPKLDISGPTKADLEVVRADGTIASTNAIELTTAASSVAAN